MSSLNTFIVPAEYLLVLCDTTSYKSFLDENWNMRQVIEHIVDEMNKNHLLAWGTGAPGNWRIEIASPDKGRRGFREAHGTVRSVGHELHLFGYEDLILAAQFSYIKLPLPKCSHWFINTTPGLYDCRVIQMFDPEKAESEEVFMQTSPHFVIEIAPSPVPIQLWQEIPWFVHGI